MRIGDQFVIMSTPQEKEDKFLGKYWNCLIKPIRAKITNSVNVSLFFEDDTIIPERQFFTKGTHITTKTMNENSLFRIMDISIAGTTKDGKIFTYIRIYAARNEPNFLDKYINKALGMETKDTLGGMKTIDADGNVDFKPFIFWKFIQQIARNPKILVPVQNEIKALEEIVQDLIKEGQKKDKEIERLTQLSLVAGGVNIFTRTGKVKAKYLKDFKV